MNPQRFYVTTSIPYVNGRPHIGHALEFVLTDALARHRRLRGDDVRFLSGTDDNSLTNVRAAIEEGTSTRQLVDRNGAAFFELRRHLDLSFDDFIRTSVDRRHLEGVRRLWETCQRSQDIYKRFYRGLYCVGCERFYSEDELEGGLCPAHLVPAELVEEENYFFRLSRYAEPLTDLIESRRLEIIPESRRNEVLSFIRSGLEDFSISRSVERAHGWGVPVPGDPSQVMYVWWDALGNYITALDYASDGGDFRRFWSENPNRVHVIGKDIIRFHAVYWPAMLLSAGLATPTTLFVHGFISVGGRRISKSLGNVVDPVELVAAWGCDAVRWWLLSFRATEDVDFTPERFTQVYNSDLADGIGNLVSRVTRLAEISFGGRVPEPGLLEQPDLRLASIEPALSDRVDQAMRQFAPHEALSAIWDLVDAANKYIVEAAPWTLDPERDRARLSTSVWTLLDALRVIAFNLRPFLPRTASQIADRIGAQAEESSDAWGKLRPGSPVTSGPPLFPKT